MDTKKHILEAATLIIAAVLCAVVANAMASRERKVALVGNYPNALKVPERTETPAPIVTPTPIEPPATDSVAPPTTAAPLSPRKPEKSAPPKRPDISTFKPHPDKPYVEIHGDDVAKLYANGILFLDARRTSVYDEGHIAGARNFSVWESDVDQKVNALFEERNDPAAQQQPIVIYCSGGDCEDSHMLAQKLWGIQFNNVYVYKDGFPDWQKRGGAVRRGSAP
jgi:rhodanese-related sulfurtransferase